MKKKTLQRIASAFLVAVTAVGLCACGGGSNVTVSSVSSKESNAAFISSMLSSSPENQTSSAAHPSDTSGKDSSAVTSNPPSANTSESTDSSPATNPAVSASSENSSSPAVSESKNPPVSSDLPPVSSSPVPATSEPENSSYPPLETEQVKTSTVRHIFTHCLINDPSLGSIPKDGPLDIDCITVTEFKRLLQALYDNNFVLIDINDMFTVDSTGKATMNEYVTVPKGKKPLVFSIDDVTYDPKKIGCGMIDRLVISNGTIMGAYYDIETGKETLTDGEVFPQLEIFLKSHPDFSYNGAKLTLACTGFAGVLGYRTDERYATGELTVYVNKTNKTYDYNKYYNLETERAKAKEVADWLLANGYNFACHSYSHGNYQTRSAENIKTDFVKWKANVEPIIGKTNIFIYPYGSFTYAGTAQHQALLDEGYVMFCGTAETNCLWPDKHPKNGGIATKTGTIYLERFTIDGRTLRNFSNDPTYTQNVNASIYEMGRTNYLEYCVPEQIYCNEERYLKINSPD